MKGFGHQAMGINLDDGDNVVELYSQFGCWFDESEELEKQIMFEKASLNLDTIFGHNPINHFHGQNPHRRETIMKTYEYIVRGEIDGENRKKAIKPLLFCIIMALNIIVMSVLYFNYFFRLYNYSPGNGAILWIPYYEVFTVAWMFPIT